MLSPSNCYLDKKQAQPLRFSTEELIRKRLRSHKCRARTHGHAACLLIRLEATLYFCCTIP